MPDTRTTITELVTGLGMLGFEDAETAIAARPAAMASVSPALWADLERWCSGAAWAQEFAAAFRNGAVFLDAADALRGRVPTHVDWRGSTKPVDDDLVPADLRVDHVYLVSCKYLSRILGNAAPGRLFDGLLRLRTPSERTGWFDAIAPDELRALSIAACEHAGLPPVAQAADLGVDGRRVLRDALGGSRWPERCRPPWQALVAAVSERSAERWRSALGSDDDRRRLLWRLLRIGPTPYYVLGVSSRAAGPLRLRVLTSWDWSQRYRLEDFEVAAGTGGQPRVQWMAHVRDRDHGTIAPVAGHVEVRWSHGRLNGAPEAKIYLDTPHAEVPGYLPLA